MANRFWKLTHASWSSTNATVESCDWVKSHDHAGEIAGHYQVKFAYKVGAAAETHHGEFCHSGIRHIVPYRVGENLTIQYDTRKPAHNHYSDATENYEKLEAILAMTVFALLAGYVLYTF